MTTAEQLELYFSPAADLMPKQLATYKNKTGTVQKLITLFEKNMPLVKMVVKYCSVWIPFFIMCGVIVASPKLLVVSLCIAVHSVWHLVLATLENMENNQLPRLFAYIFYKSRVIQWQELMPWSERRAYKFNIDNASASYDLDTHYIFRDIPSYQLRIAHLICIWHDIVKHPIGLLSVVIGDIVELTLSLIHADFHLVQMIFDCYTHFITSSIDSIWKLATNTETSSFCETYLRTYSASTYMSRTVLYVHWAGTMVIRPLIISINLLCRPLIWLALPLINITGLVFPKSMGKMYSCLLRDLYWSNIGISQTVVEDENGWLHSDGEKTAASQLAPLSINRKSDDKKCTEHDRPYEIYTLGRSIFG
jgi:hypothetical protein